MDQSGPGTTHAIDDLVLWETRVDEVPLEDALHSPGAFFVPPDAYLLAADDRLFAGVARPGPLFDLVTGRVAPRNRSSGVTLYRESRGRVHDAALANRAYERARERGRGVEFDFR